MPFNRRSVIRFMHRRFILAAVIVALLVAVPAVLAITGVPFSGSFSSASPTFTRPSSCTSLSSKTAYYATQEFNVGETATYTIETTDANLAPSAYGPQDTFLILYQDSFDPANPLTNCLARHDDISFPSNVLSRITMSLPAGHYIAVITTYDGTATGTYEGFISGPGMITLGTSAPEDDPIAPAPDAPAPPWNPGDGRLNPDPAAPAAVYYDSDALKVYMLNEDAKGYEVLSMPGSEIMDLCRPVPAANTLIASADEGHVRLYCLSTGEIQLNVNQGATETAYVWDALPASTQHTYTFNADGELLSEAFKTF